MLPSPPRPCHRQDVETGCVLSALGTRPDLDFLANSQTSSASLTESGLSLRRTDEHVTSGSPVLASTKEEEHRESPSLSHGRRSPGPQTADPVLRGAPRDEAEPLASPVPGEARRGPP